MNLQQRQRNEKKRLQNALFFIFYKYIFMYTKRYVNAREINDGDTKSQAKNMFSSFRIRN